MSGLDAEMQRFLPKPAITIATASRSREWRIRSVVIVFFLIALRLCASPLLWPPIP
ncbi:hypothetical protein FIBSPDRAFT_855284 [Athelia psychrophila]|uniref:Uncharacterized protein n=1 Tax=Athelia psychrophila TaxID=1759441 RepID=A0A166PDX5_9AGAM|nr:hypothetical protein FIBSPDRAFT_855284 [Fibularhizoctonia sp. CBS 109695]